MISSRDSIEDSGRLDTRSAGFSNSKARLATTAAHYKAIRAASAFLVSRCIEKAGKIWNVQRPSLVSEIETLIELFVRSVAPHLRSRFNPAIRVKKLMQTTTPLTSKFVMIVQV